MPIVRRVLVGASIIRGVGAASAQTAVIKRNSNLRPDASMNRQPLRLLPAGEPVDLPGLVFENGYYKVHTRKDETGWAWARNVRLDRLAGTEGARLQLLQGASLRSDASTRQAPVRMLNEGETLDLVDPAPTRGFYHVRTAQGEDGWVWSAAVVAAGGAAAAAKPASEPVAAPPKPPTAVPTVAAKTAVEKAATPTTRAAIASPTSATTAAATATALKATKTAAVAATPTIPPEVEKKEPAAAGALHPGDTLGRENAQLAQDLLPPEILRHYEQGGYRNKIVSYPSGGPRWEAAWVAATKANADRFTVDDRGTIIDKSTGQQPPYLYGIPFPNIDIKDPKAGVKVVWNQAVAVWYEGNVHTHNRLVMMSAKGVERQLAAEGWYLYYQGASPKYRPAENPLDLQEQFLGFVLAPADLQGTASLTWRYHDPEKRDSNWAFVPALRRVRAVSPANRSDGYLGTDVCADDGNFFDGKPQEFDWKLVEQRDALRLLDPDAVSGSCKPQPVPGGGWEVVGKETNYYGFEMKGWTGVPWAMPSAVLARRPVWIVEGRPRDKYYLFGRIELWIDAETWDGSYHRKFAWTGDHISTYQVLGRINQVTGAQADAESLECEPRPWNVAENFKMNRASLGGARVTEKGTYIRRLPIDPTIFESGALMRLGK